MEKFIFFSHAQRINNILSGFYSDLCDQTMEFKALYSMDKIFSFLDSSLTVEAF